MNSLFELPKTSTSFYEKNLDSIKKQKNTVGTATAGLENLQNGKPYDKIESGF